ncbi:MAG TPA: aminotransferase class I/II-fold pyridoxal phosphate-dependent enzyme [Segeticoccus sp.]|uniref:MalY/PatB family protein n=1 Tax=Segeticoccus sp. TaxID=2706531 RepID=UPI002D80B885|nr:aminotransferase class I/II-fold pyridoxal phosphate-dependent enzyme [Segeticoccus sp.]HET8601025.1 aminotransferase class I/II-fold pyridoxal phosphate-dependent enzyme [Segeticoccus sp.]
MAEPHEGLIVDRTDEQLRATGAIKWAAAPPGVLPAWVAEMDFAVAEPIARALHEAVDVGRLGYGPPDEVTGVPEALADFAADRWGWHPDPAHIVLAGDVVEALARVITTLCEDAPVVVPTPAYPPFLEVPAHTGRRLVTVAHDPDALRATHDLEAIDRELAAGARTLVLCSPHNPWGRAFTREELTALRDVADRHGAMVLSDEIHAPLVLPGHEHVPYATVAGPESRYVTLTSATKSWNMPGVKCAQVICTNAADADRVRAFPLHPTQSSLGTAATRAAYRDGRDWLDAVVERIDANRQLFGKLVAERLPRVRMRPLEATYLAWLDARAYGLGSPGAVALERGRVWVDHREWGPGGEGHVRVNLATSPERVEQVVDRLALAWESA